MNEVLLIFGFVLLELTTIMTAPIGQSRPFRGQGRRRPETDDEMKFYLSKYGHWKSRSRNRNYETDEDFKNSMRTFQRFFNLNVTGEADNETLELMSTPRCGLPDNSTLSRRKRYSLYGNKWPITGLTILFQNYTPDLPVNVTRNAILRSLKDWSDVSRLSFTESKTTSANIKLLFARLAHGDNDSFDGTGGTLAHAFYPPVGNTHFDEDEKWTDTSSGTNLRQVATHELGHALGLRHSTVKAAVMYPYYYYKSNFTLDKDDIQGIQALYGAPAVSSSSSSSSSSSRSPSSSRASSISSTKTSSTSRTSTSTTRPSSTRWSTSSSTTSTSRTSTSTTRPSSTRWSTSSSTTSTSRTSTKSTISPSSKSSSQTSRRRNCSSYYRFFGYC